MNDERNLDFVRQIVLDDVASDRHGGRVLTRFPPEPNGYLHVGHAEAIFLDFGVAAEHGGRTTLRMDDTNPTTEDPSFVEAITRDIQWLGFEWDGEVRYASDYFDALYRMALRMIEDGFAYVDSLSESEIRAYRGSVTEPGRPSPHRDRPAEESLDLFRRMRAGEFEDGAHVLRAKIDLAAPNMKMRDPLMYRIRHAHHYRTGDEWPIYPMYDWAHGQSDAIEGITHSLCTLEFENNRELYDWFIEHTRPSAARLEDIPGAWGGGTDELGSWDPRPRQYEFARLNLDYTIVSKRKLKRLVESGRVDGWDDPRLPTIAALRRRGVPPEAIGTFIEHVGIAKADKRVDIGTFEYAIRHTLNRTAPRVMCVIDPLPVVIENFDEALTGEIDWMEAPYFPRDVEEPPADWPASRPVPFTRNLAIEREDFSEDPPKGFRRLAPGREIRLRHGFFVTCTGVEKDEAGGVVGLRCTYDPETRGGSAPDGRKVAGTIHWVSADASLPVEVRIYDRLFSKPDPHEGVEDPLDNLNPDSLRIFTDARVEPSVADDDPATAYQFERQGYFIRDSHAPDGELVFNRTVSLRDTWSARAEATVRSADSATATVSGPIGEDRGRAERDRAREESPGLVAAMAGLIELGLSEDLADLLTGSEADVEFFEAARSASAEPAGRARAIANWLVHEVRGVSEDGARGSLTTQGLASLADLVEDGTVSRQVAKELLARLVQNGGDPTAMVEAEGLARIADSGALAMLIEDVLSGHPDEVERYRGGQTGLMGFFVGQVMRASGGRADAAAARELLTARLD
ncbi:MAG: glutamine--tRNA ligase/YqeY domain fusion protein [Gemmatimonadota bacterium]|nr:glutamine--tRNA ligase/YqeY domain fusion protein [Gemmatimonadota bacterium]